MATITAGQLRPGHLIELKHGVQVVSHTIVYPPINPTNGRQRWDMLDVFLVGHSYPLYFRSDIEVEVAGIIDLTNPRAVAGVPR